MSTSRGSAYLAAGLLASVLSLSNLAAQSPNILVLVADDLGTESLASYGFGSPTAVTPNLDRLGDEGVRFEGFWSQPSCSPTRSAVMTGRYAFRTGVFGALSFQWGALDAPTPVMPGSANKELFYGRGTIYPDPNAYVTRAPAPDRRLPMGPTREELMLPAAIKSLPAGYSTAAVGKWHLADLMNGGVNHPNDSGFDYFSAALFGGPARFSAWRHLENGKLTAESGYIDMRSTEDALRWINEQGDRP